MKNTLTIDSSVFLSAFLGMEPQSRLSVEFFTYIKNHNIRIIMPILVIFEIIQGYYRNTKNLNKTKDIFEELIRLNISNKLKILNLDASFLTGFIAGHHFFDLKTSDTVVAISALSSETRLISWDKKLITQCGEKVHAVTPKEFLAKVAH